MKLYNTLSRQKEEFTPYHPPKVTVYACGPTVYHFAHIGNLRTYVSEDILIKTLRYLGYDVLHGMNITDVGHLTGDGDDGEDKILQGAKREKKTVYEIAKYYEDVFFDDCKKLNIQKPDKVARATSLIDDYISFIQVLEAKGVTYRAGGNVYFDITKFEDYTKLSKMPLDELKHGAREDVQVDQNKKNPHDFVLWFTKSKFQDQEMKWDSPFGMGYPGWHIECSVISMKLLGEQLDIHCGGVDHIAVHHTNEIAQSETYTGKPWVKYWWHAEFLIDSGGKMSKSRGEFLSLALLEEKGYEPLSYRYYLLGSHYRKQQEFSFASLENAQDEYRKLKRRVLDLGTESETLRESKHRDDFISYLSDDLNTSNALSVIYAVLKDKDLTNAQKVGLIEEFDEVLSLDLLRADEMDDSFAKKVQTLIDLRSQAKAQKDYQKADEIRDQLLAMNIEINDRKEGTTWKKC